MSHKKLLVAFNVSSLLPCHTRLESDKMDSDAGSSRARIAGTITARSCNLLRFG